MKEKLRRNLLALLRHVMRCHLFQKNAWILLIRLRYKLWIWLQILAGPPSLLSPFQRSFKRQKSKRCSSLIQLESHHMFVHLNLILMCIVNTIRSSVITPKIAWNYNMPFRTLSMIARWPLKRGGPVLRIAMVEVSVPRMLFPIMMLLLLFGQW